MQYARLIKKPIYIFSQLALLVVLSACGGGSGGGAGAGGSSGGSIGSAPSATIVFPSAASVTESDSITVRGTASDDGEIAIVRVNGVDASSTDGFASWSATVPLNLGVNTLVVETGDTARNENSNVTSVVVQRQAGLDVPSKVALDSANNRLFVIDGGRRAIIVVDLSTGVRSVLSGYGTPDFNHLFVLPNALELDSANNRLLVVDSSQNVLMAVDLTTGARSIVSENGVPGSTVDFAAPRGLALDSADNRAYIADSSSGEGFVIEVDLSTGGRDVLSDNTMHGGLTAFQRIQNVVLHSDLNRLYVTDANIPAIISVSLIDGTRFWVSHNTARGAGVALNGPRDLVLDEANNRLLVTDTGQDSILAIDLSSGDRSLLTGAHPAGFTGFENANGVELDSSNNRVLVTDANIKAVLGVSLDDGAHEFVVDGAFPSRDSVMQLPQGMAIDRESGRAYVVDSNLRSVTAIDLSTGTRSLLSGIGVPDTDNPLSGPIQLVLDSVGNRLIVLDRTLAALIAVDLTTGARTVLSDNTMHGGAEPFVSLTGIAMDSANNRVLVVNNALTVPGISDGPTVLAVSLADGSRTHITDNSLFSGAFPLDQPKNIAVDHANNRALILDTALDALLTVDLNEGPTLGQRNMLSADGTPDSVNVFSTPAGIAVDVENNRALVADAFASRLTAVDLDTGARSVLSQGTEGLEWESPSDVALAGEDQALLLDISTRALIGVDLLTGQRVIYSSSK